MAVSKETNYLKNQIIPVWFPHFVLPSDHKHQQEITTALSATSGPAQDIQLFSSRGWTPDTFQALTTPLAKPCNTLNWIT